MSGSHAEMERAGKIVAQSSTGAWTGTGRALRAMMVPAAAAFLASAYLLDFWWYAGWRFAAGLAGGVLSGTLVPPLLEAGLATTWHALGAGALAIAPAIDMLGGRRRVARAPGSAVSTA